MRLLRQVPAITELSHLDAAGREQLRVSRLAMDVVGSADRLFAETRNSARPRAETYFGPVYFRKESEPYMTIAVPGAEAASPSRRSTSSSSGTSSRRSRSARQGWPTWSTTRRAGRPSRHQPGAAEDRRWRPRAGEGRAGRRGQRREVTIARDRRGGKCSPRTRAIAPLGWFVLVEQPWRKPSRRSTPRPRTACWWWPARAVGAGQRAAGAPDGPADPGRCRRARPSSARAISDQRIEVHTGDELEALADEFNRMAGRLRESYATLEQKVEERTRELAEALEQQTATARDPPRDRELTDRHSAGRRRGGEIGRAPDRRQPGAHRPDRVDRALRLAVEQSTGQ